MVSKKEKVLEVATRLFAVRGFDGTSVRKIADEAGLSVAGMFHYFSSKEEILFEIMSSFLDEGLKRLKEICSGSGGTVQRLEEVCRFFTEYFAGHMDELTILSSEGKSLTREHREVFKQKQREYLEAVKRLLEELQAQGLLKDMDITVLSFLFFGMALWTSRWYNPKGKVSPKELGDMMSEVFLRGILKEGSR